MSTNLALAQAELKEYFESVTRVSMLSAEEERRIATLWRQTGAKRHSDKLVSANLRFVVKIALEYRNYGFSVADLVQEGNLGLVRAVQTFDPERGFRLISYAVWWIRAYIQEYILKHWSLVKIGTTQLQRRLFNHMQSAQKRIRRMLTEGEEQEAREHLARAVGGTVKDVEEMERRLSSRDVSLDHSQAPSESDSTLTMHDRLASPDDSAEDLLEAADMSSKMTAALKRAMGKLGEREKAVVVARHLGDEPLTLRELGARLGVSKERVRQIEDRALRVLREQISADSASATLVAA